MRLNLFFLIFLIILTSVCDTVNQLFLKNAINSLNFNLNSMKKVFSFILRIGLIPRVWIGFIFSCLSLFIWLFILSKVDLNLAFSIDSMHYIFIAFASKLFLREKVDPKRWTGTILIVLGIFLVSITSRN